MSRFPELATLVLSLVLVALPAAAEKAKPAGYYGHGEPASQEQIAGWDIDMRPDGVGLPPGSGSVEDGEMLYEEQCAECHGSFGEGEGGIPRLLAVRTPCRKSAPTRPLAVTGSTPARFGITSTVLCHLPARNH